MGKSSNYTSTKTQSKVKLMADSAEGLPKGWRVEIKTRKSGPKVGDKYKCYVAPVTGCKFYSKGQVSRYLESRPKKERNVPKQSENVVIERRDTVGGLPPGWSLELKVSKKGNRIRSDPYYTDPVSGYVFRSKKDVLRYLKTGKRGKYAFKPKERDIHNVKQADAQKERDTNNVKKADARTSPSSTAKIQKLNGSVESCTTGVVENAQLSSLVSVDTKSSKVRKAKNGMKKGSLSAQPTNVPPSESQLVENGVEEHEKRKTQVCCRKRKNQIEIDTPRRVSKRLARINAELASDVERPNGTSQEAAVLTSYEAKLAVDSQSGSRAVNCLVTGHFNQLESEKECISTSHATTGDDTLKQEVYQVEQQTTMTQASKCEESLNQGVVGTGKQTTQHGTLQPLCDLATLGKVDIETQAEEKLETPFALPFGEIWADPCLEFAYKTLTGAIPVEENLGGSIPDAIPTLDPCLEFAYKTLTGEIPVEANLSVAIPDALPISDPCLEFAYKTLTGAISLEDSMAVQDYFQHQLSSTQTRNNSLELPDISIDDFCQNDFQFDSIAKPASPCQLQNPVIQVSPSKSVLDFSNNLVQHPTGDMKMECKRREVNP